MIKDTWIGIYFSYIKFFERLRKSWKDSVKELLQEIGVDWEQAYDRK